MKKELSFEMFDRISTKYDRINRILSGGIDLYWRQQLIKQIPLWPVKMVDLATGTGDQLFAAAKKRILTEAVGLDLSKNMLSIASQKADAKNIPASFGVADAQNLPLKSDTFDITSISFGIRNVADPVKCLSEMHRVLHKGGKALILEFSLPKIKGPYLFYLRHILPKIGKWLSRDEEAYRYLNETIEAFPYGEDFINLMKQAGFKTSRAIPLTFGIATLYVGVK